ncbi:unnamed protein product [Calicophoron daubneyi]|uniref:Hexosyltransferase n=1 Tax=Calicophoron daubneyi TaxID=300641 RepID=A0AAV2U0A6_CALDB
MSLLTFFIRRRYLVIVCLHINLLLAFLLYDILLTFSSINRKFLSLNVTNPNEKLVLITSKHNRWLALGQLNGSLFRVAYSAFQCSSLSLPTNTVRRRKSFQPLYRFVGSELYDYPLHVDAAEKVCRFRQGEVVSEGSHEDREFPLLITGETLCSNSVSGFIDLLILVKSPLNHTAERKIIRNSWGKMKCWKGKVVRLVFLVAFLDDHSQLASLTNESQEYGDIVQQKFYEDYHNTTYKIILGLKWGITFCAEAQWYLFADEDTFVNPRAISRYIDQMNSVQMPRVVAGCLIRRSAVLRNDRKPFKWSVDADLYPFSRYPPYVSGPAVLISADLALDLYVASRFTNYFPLDDVFLGLVMNKLLIRPLPIPYIYTLPVILSHLDNLRSIIVVHGFYEHKVKLWLWSHFKMNGRCKLEE